MFRHVFFVYKHVSVLSEVSFELKKILHNLPDILNI